ncbi:hypothetical protein E2C01_076845 [Portunus trituberculatus]|uniref:Uncharacterized protein n=1 Tax=Portunus trituberculatus TaxID=210409 RepID=A0A5B7IN31_PORTR|nr:hypothetical protein [Portunus trituberculatus]
MEREGVWRCIVRGKEEDEEKKKEEKEKKDEEEEEVEEKNLSTRFYKRYVLSLVYNTRKDGE